ncbi:hypothetical protein ABG768_004952, partial [Culter alburnus]
QTLLTARQLRRFPGELSSNGERLLHLMPCRSECHATPPLAGRCCRIPPCLGTCLA